ncbi:TetR family transcriptional regulator [Agromyces sp. CFH 90414]|uniref:TetR family transcriptional regulator n=1 Tax=Agromyces agglutinans TaxID=2662258 RepID=A0A6I2FC57_9MICO|nr:TetR/AcrR family transcriptional regulator [Agromyces agglutinans]MRG60046.1 TetR family transcriptional regulator [Agromyces agglutinans]
MSVPTRVASRARAADASAPDGAPDEAGVAVRRGPGRPRDDELDGVILTAALELIDADEPVTVARVVARSGVSRATLYRRWPSLTTLVAAALDVGREDPAPVVIGADLRDRVVASLLGAPDGAQASGFPEQRFRQRIRLAMADRELQQAYWRSHVSRRRASLETALAEGIRLGLLRTDLDVAACFDLLAGVFYYQVVVRGARFDDPATRARCQSAIEVAWRGMEV